MFSEQLLTSTRLSFLRSIHNIILMRPMFIYINIIRRVKHYETKVINNEIHFI